MIPITDPDKCKVAAALSDTGDVGAEESWMSHSLWVTSQQQSIPEMKIIMVESQLILLKWLETSQELWWSDFDFLPRTKDFPQICLTAHRKIGRKARKNFTSYCWYGATIDAMSTWCKGNVAVGFLCCCQHMSWGTREVRSRWLNIQGTIADLPKRTCDTSVLGILCINYDVYMLEWYMVTLYIVGIRTSSTLWARPF